MGIVFRFPPENDHELISELTRVAESFHGALEIIDRAVNEFEHAIKRHRDALSEGRELNRQLLMGAWASYQVASEEHLMGLLSAIDDWAYALREWG